VGRRKKQMMIKPLKDGINQVVHPHHSFAIKTHARSGEAAFDLSTVPPRV